MTPKWFDYDERSVLMFEDTKEVIGQAVHVGLHWLAYDNARSKHDGNGAVLLGRFRFRDEAKKAVYPGFYVVRLTDNSELHFQNDAPRMGDYIFGTRQGQEVWWNEKTGVVQGFPPR